MTRMILAILALMATFITARESYAQERLCESNERFVVHCVRPSEIDPRVTRFDDPNYVLYARGTLSEDQPLLVFLPGTNGKPPGALPFIRTAAEHGYRVISLEYNDDTSIAVYCPDRPDPGCSARFRKMRLYGGITMDPAIDNTRPEAIVNRLYHLVLYLDRQFPNENWARYADKTGLKWDRIALAGQSQGAGMAAFIGKSKLVNRIILFSSPWDFYDRGRRRILAPWLAWNAKTPPNRWYGAYNAREDTARLLEQAYATLNIPPDHIRVFNEVIPNIRPDARNPYHTQGISNPIYRPEWIFLLTGR